MIHELARKTSGLVGLLCAVVCMGFTATGQADDKVVKVLMVTGDWKTQPWYQDTWMPGVDKKSKQLYRGRFIKAEVDKVAPGKFEFTDINSYLGQEYMDADYLSQFDVVLLGDITGWSLNPRFLATIGDYVKNGGGLIYCASWKWHCSMLPKENPFVQVLPAEFPVNNVTDDWRMKEEETATDDKDFKPVPTPDGLKNPATKGLDWNSVPTLDKNFKIIPKTGAEVLLKTAKGNPTLVAWQCGQGRAMLSSSIFANDEVSPKIGDWKDFGKYYSQVLGWLGANSKNTKAVLKNSAATVTASVDFNKQLNTVSASLFSVHGAHSCEGQALPVFNELKPKGEFARFPASDQPGPGKFDFNKPDKELAQIERFGMEPICLFGAYGYGNPKWLWQQNGSWEKASDGYVAAVIADVVGNLEHWNGKSGTPGYKTRVKYIELFNEPPIKGDTITGYAKIFNAVAERVHKDFPDVKVGGGGFYELPYMKMFIDKCGKNIDWISRHPYGWTGEMVFRQEDDLVSYAKSKGDSQIKFIITEWDFWIQGREKFDYMIKRDFESAKRQELLGTLHYCYAQYVEPIYLFGIIWDKWGQDIGAGPAYTPMHDAYDSLWIFRDFRGARAQVEKTVPAGVAPKLTDHVLVDAVKDGNKLDAVLYYDWAYGGTGYKDYAKGVCYDKVKVELKLAFAPSNKERTVTVSKATGEGFEIVKKDIKIPAGNSEYSDSIEIAPLTAMSVSVE